MRTAALAIALTAACAADAAQDAKPRASPPVLQGLTRKANPEQAAAPWLATAWRDYKDRFIIDGRVIDNVNRISHSEGQGYAMLIAVRAQDQAAFEQIWRWTKRELFVRADGLASWKWSETARPRVADHNNATDGDLLIAWALVEAGERWRQADYVDSARQIVGAIGRHAIARTKAGVVVKPAIDGFSEREQPDGPVVNLSYWVFPAFEKLKGLSPEIPWAEVQETGLGLIRASRFGPLRLPSDWVALADERPQPARNFPARFSYNAIRIPLHLAWAGLGSSHELRPYRGLWNESLDVGPFEVDLATGGALETLGGIGFKAVAALASCAAEQRKVPAALRSVPSQNYYPATLHILSLIALHERYPQCL